MTVIHIPDIMAGPILLGLLVWSIHGTIKYSKKLRELLEDMEK